MTTVTSKRIALLVDVVLSRLGSALLILVFLVAAFALTIGLFPRTLLGTLILIAVGVPLYVLGYLCFIDRSRPLSLRVPAFIGFIALLALLWWWSASHASFMRQNFY